MLLFCRDQQLLLYLLLVIVAAVDRSSQTRCLNQPGIDFFSSHIVCVTTHKRLMANSFQVNLRKLQTKLIRMSTATLLRHIDNAHSLSTIF